MFKLSVIAALALVALAAPVASAAEVNGCDVTLQEDGGQYATIIGGPDGGETVFDAVDGVIELSLDGNAHEQLAPGSYVAQWDTGIEDSFTLACDVGPDPTLDPEATDGIDIASEPSPDAGIGTPITRIKGQPEITPGVTLPETSTAPVVYTPGSVVEAFIAFFVIALIGYLGMKEPQ
jgi:hypothetical protein